MSPVTHRHPTRTVCSLIVLCLIAAGCEKDPITTYTIDKAVDQPPVIAPTPPVRPVRPPDAAVAGAKGPVRLLGAVTKTDTNSWYFKLVGPEAAITEQAEALARRLIEDEQGDEQRIARLYQLAYSRKPDSAEKISIREFFTRYRNKSGHSQKTSKQEEQKVLTSLCRVVLTGNEFFFIE